MDRCYVLDLSVWSLESYTSYQWCVASVSLIFSSEDVGLGSNRWLDHVRHCKLLVDVIDGMCK